MPRYDNYDAIGLLTGAAEGFARGYAGMKDQQMKQMEFDSKIKADQESRERNARLDDLAERKFKRDSELDEMRIRSMQGQNGLLNQIRQQNLENSQKPKEHEYTAAGFAKRMEGAEGKLAELLALDENGDGSPDFDPTSKEVALQEGLPGWLEFSKNKNVKNYEQSKRDFISAVLRKESGAAISPQEYASEAKKYFPQAGDSPEVLKNKALSRAQAFENLKAQSGRAYGLIPTGMVADGLIKGPTNPVDAGSVPADGITPDQAAAELARRKKASKTAKRGKDAKGA